MEKIDYKYQLFNLRILFFVFMNCLWLIICNLLFVGQWNFLLYVFFGSGLLIIDYIFFPHLTILFKRDGKIFLSENELLFKYKKKERRVNSKSVIRVTYNIMSTMNVKFGVMNIELKEENNIKIYFEDINNDNERFYFNIYKKVKEYEEQSRN